MGDRTRDRSAGGGPAARRRVVEVLEAVDGGDDLDRVLDRVLDARPLPDRDRSFVTALCCAVVRHRTRIDDRIARASSRALPDIDPRVLAVLRIGVAQHLELDSVPAYAVVDSSVRLARSLRRDRACGYVNAVLRSTLRDGNEREAAAWRDLDPVDRIAARHSFPPWMVRRWAERDGIDGAEGRCRSLNTPAPLTLRLRPGEDRDAVLEALREAGREAEPSPWLEDAIRVRSGRPTDLPGWDAGRFRVQDEASQLVACLLGTLEGRVLDACAGMGTKTHQLLEARGDEPGLLVALDRSLPRLRRLTASLPARSPAAPAVVAADAAGRLPFPDGTFGRVLVDAPCSGLGAIRRHPEIKWRRSIRDLERCAELQIGILSEACRVLAPGGVAVYATCTQEPEENEQVVDAVVAMDPALRVQDCRPYLPTGAGSGTGPEGDPYMRTSPGGDGMDSFFAARLRRLGTDGEPD